MNLQYILKISFIFFLLLSSSNSFSQLKKEQEVKKLREVIVKNDFKKLYAIQLRRVRRVYPLALEAARMIEKLDEELETSDSKRQKRKTTRKFHEEVKQEYLYVIKDLYVEEGKLLMKLIYRETGMTVAQIISKYKNRFSSELYDQLGKLWDQNLDAKYDPYGEDFITEIVINDIKNNVVSFDPEPRHMSKDDFKTEMKEYRANKRAARRMMRQQRRAASEAVNNEEE